MTTFSRFLGEDHNRCDDLFACAEGAVASGDWERAAEAHQRFYERMELHFTMEEEVLFPAFEIASGSSEGPTAVMRHEHAQMRQLISEMALALEAKRSEDFLGASETLLVLMQQHNAKEEQILYPSSEQLLSEQQPALLAMMQDISETG